MIKSKQSSLRILRKIHTYVGLGSFMILCWLAISGLFLNHTDGLKLSTKFTDNAAVLSLYNIPNLVFSQGVQINGQWIFAADNNIYAQNSGLLIANKPFTSALLKGNITVVASGYELLFFTNSGEYIDNLVFEQEILKIGLNKTQLIVQGKTGNLAVNENYTEVSRHNNRETVKWQLPKKLPDRLKYSVSKTKTISLERLLLDAHSGRILGIFGVYFMDFMAILLIFMGISGVLIWTIRKINKRTYWR